MGKVALASARAGSSDILSVPLAESAASSSPGEDGIHTNDVISL